MKPKLYDQLKAELLTESFITPERLAGLDQGWADNNSRIDKIIDKPEYDQHFNQDTQWDDA